jgi:hypothetical protein
VGKRERRAAGREKRGEWEMGRRGRGRPKREEGEVGLQEGRDGLPTDFSFLSPFLFFFKLTQFYLNSNKIGIQT